MTNGTDAGTVTQQAPPQMPIPASVQPQQPAPSQLQPQAGTTMPVPAQGTQPSAQPQQNPQQKVKQLTQQSKQNIGQAAAAVPHVVASAAQAQKSQSNLRDKMVIDNFAKAFVSQVHATFELTTKIKPLVAELDQHIKQAMEEAKTDASKIPIVSYLVHMHQAAVQKAQEHAKTIKSTQAQIQAMTSDPKTLKILSKGAGWDEKSANAPERQMMTAAFNQQMQEVDKQAQVAMFSTAPGTLPGQQSQGGQQSPDAVPVSGQPTPPQGHPESFLRKFGHIAGEAGKYAAFAIAPSRAADVEAVMHAPEQRKLAQQEAQAKIEEEKAQAEYYRTHAGAQEPWEERQKDIESGIEEKLTAAELKSQYDTAKLDADTAYKQWQMDPKNPRNTIAMLNAKAHMLSAEASMKKSGTQGHITGFGAYTLYRMAAEGYTHNPELLKAIPALAKSMGLDLPPEIQQVLSQVPENQPLSPESGKPIGTSMPEAPTPSTRTSAQNAQRFLDEYPRISAEVDAAASNLGPVKGREVMGFLLGTVGSTGNPQADKQLSQLRTDLTLVASNAAKFHVSSVRQAELFDRLSGMGKSTAPAIQGYLQGIKAWATTAAKQERGYGEQGPPRPKNVPANATWNPQGNNGKGSWKLPQ